MAEAIERLQLPDVRENWSAVTGAPVLVVDARLPCALPSAVAQAAAAVRLAELPCPAVALVGATTPAAAREILAAFDVVVATVDELTAVRRAVMAAPVAAATLVHVLRVGATLGVPDTLSVESLAYATLQGGPEFARWLGARPPAGTLRPAPMSPAPLGPVVSAQRGDDTLVLTLDRPDRHNAFSARMRDELVDVLAVAVGEPQLAVVLRGAGPSFCSGGDLDEFGTLPDPATAHLVRTTRSPARLLASMGARLRAEVHGACIGAGIELAAFAHQVIATPDAFFRLPEIGMGLIPGAGGTASLPRRIGRQRTGYLALTGARLDARTALAWGLVDAVTEIR